MCFHSNDDQVNNVCLKIVRACLHVQFVDDEVFVEVVEEEVDFVEDTHVAHTELYAHIAEGLS